MLLRYPRFALHNALRRLGWLWLVLLTSAGPALAQLEPAAQYTKLSVAQLLAWTPTGPTAVPQNVSRVTLAGRQNTLSTQINPAQSFSHKINYIPDGMSGFAGYLNEQNRFNLYNFTHWQYIDVLTWFDGPVALPTRPWVEAAHRNGVKVIGSVFTSAADVNLLIQKDGNGEYAAAQKLVDVATYYGFDGWFFNQESSVPAATAIELRNLLKRLQQLRPAGMEIHWYDAMLPGGSISYQNALNANNQLLLQDGPARVSDAMFTNYFWTGATNINTSVTTATSLGRSPFDVYMGADLWPNRNPQALFTRTNWLDNYFAGGDRTQPLLSVGLFAANLTFNGGFNSFNSSAADYAGFYQTEQRLFAGNDLDVTTEDATGWKGFGSYVPVRSVINSLPFDTYFSVGQGKMFANNGEQLVKGWTDMGKQSLLPSWQWNKTGTAPVTVDYDFSRAYYAGTSVKLQGSLSGSNSATVKLFQTKLPLPAATITSLDVTFKTGAVGPANAKLLLYFADDLSNPAALDLGTTTDTLWTTRTFVLGNHAGRELALIGVQATAAAPVASYRLNLGRLKLYSGAAVTTKPTVDFAASATVVIPGQPVTFSNASTNASIYRWTFEGGTPAASAAVFPGVSYAAPGTYSVKLRATNAAGRDSLTRTGYITVVNPNSSGGNSSLSFDGASKYVDAGPVNLTGAALSMECWLKPTGFKTGSPFISSVMGMEDGANTALVRLGDANQAANRLQFVMLVNGITRKVNSPTDLTAGTWYHVAATYDGTALRLYLNGQLNASLNATGSFVANSNFFLGRNFDNSRVLNGSLDEVRTWTRALTAAEIQANMCAVPATTAGLEAYWSFNEGSGLVTLDQTGHGHQGTLVNMVPTDWSSNVPAACVTLAVQAARAAAPLIVAAVVNPVPGQQAEVEIRGAQGQPTQVQLLNLLGAVVWQQQVQPGRATERVAVPLPAAAGLYVVRVSTSTSTATVKLLKQ
ncbi:endo-beta-N-acetylglucosaminidase [Hymenobacter chitinivorans]|uniref:Putative secreted protein (Por secretion system target) n=1 Tax=Hymenobacter chitinivorans DSM 11115 TaxID=1121954 RepID=A0A2M9BSW4_9BACT|nr:LamG-like jellyroll fold domain-containing protein [Hymenobacter chitinivorans]PJJ61023.1 putative secreted protein (Por secretion system target) [Hymenobacter chitinivorans DSM 11115]